MDRNQEYHSEIMFLVLLRETIIPPNFKSYYPWMEELLED